MITLDYRYDKIDRIDPEVGTVIKLIYKDGSQRLVMTCRSKRVCRGCALLGAGGTCSGYRIRCSGRIFKDVEAVLEEL